MSEQSEKLDQLRDKIADEVKDIKELRGKFNELMKEIEPIYKEISNKQGDLFRAQDDVKRYGLVKGHLNLQYLIESLEGILKVDKTPRYDRVEEELITETMRDNQGNLPDCKYTSWLTPKNIAERLLQLIKEDEYEVPYEHLYFRDERR